MTQHHQNRKYADCSAGSQRVIAEVLSDIENNLAEPFRACEGLESRRMSIKEAAEYVGIFRACSKRSSSARRIRYNKI